MPETVTRTIELDQDPADTWHDVADPRGLETWLADEAQLEPVVGAPCRFVEGGCERVGVVEEVAPGERIAWRWWPVEQCDEVSTVRIEVEPTPQGSRVSIVETLIVASARPAASITSRRAPLLGRRVRA